MRWLIGLALIAACSTEEPMANPDASVVDSGPMDGGPGTTACGSAICTTDQFCLVQPTGPCESRDGGGCAPSEEACQSAGANGCTSTRTRACEALPTMCAASCVCLISSNPCPAAIRADCRRPQGAGFIVECPFQ